MDVMERFGNWYHGNDDREKEPPKGGLRRVIYILWNYTGGLVAANLLFLVCCIPVITIPAALAALNRYLIKIFRDGYGASLSDFLTEFKAGVFRYLSLGLVVGGLGFYGYYLMSLAGNYGGDAAHDVLLGMGFAAVLAAVILGSYSFLLAAMFELPVKHLLRNAGILSFAEWRYSLLAAAAVLLFVAALLLLAPYSLLLVILGGGAVPQLLVCAALNPAIQKRMIEPYEKQKNMVK